MGGDRWAPALREDGTPTGMYARESPPELRTGQDPTSPTYSLMIEPKAVVIRGPRLPRVTIRVDKESGGGWRIDPSARATQPGGLVEVWLEIAERERWEALRDLEP
jgi:hypothetical protein